MAYILSVVLPVKNGSGSVLRQLQALVDQRTDRSFEVIVVVNGSTDGTMAECFAFSESYSNVRVVDAVGIAGRSAAVNHGVLLAQADLVATVDHDDLVAPGWVEGMVTALSKSDLAGGPIRLQVEPLSLESDSVNEFTSELAVHCRFLPFASGSNFGFSRRVFDSLKGFDGRLDGAEDVDFSWRAQLAGYSLGFARGARVVKGVRSDYRLRFKQHRGYGLADVALDERFSGVGHRGLRPKTLRQILWLLLHVSDIRSAEGRSDWMAVAGRVYGIVLGLSRWPYASLRTAMGLESHRTELRGSSDGRHGRTHAV